MTLWLQVLLIVLVVDAHFVRALILPSGFLQDFVFLGTASGYPSPDRGASGLVLRNLQNGDHWLFDCGEGTQIQAQRSSNVRLGRISNIFISHLHGDHMYGLPGLLCTIDQKGTAGDIALPSSSGSPSEAVVNIYGPQGLRRSHMNYTYAVHELILRDEHRPAGWEDWCSLEADPVRDPPLHCERPGRDIHADSDGFWYNINRPDDMGISVHSMALSHTIPSLGWLIVHPPKPPALCVETARMLGVPDGPLMGQLKKGEPVVVNGQTVYPDQVLKTAVRGHRVAIMGDSYDSSELERLLLRLADERKISQATLDVLVHEATLQDSMREEARTKGHSTPTPVVQLAAQLKARLLILTHFSHRYTPIGRLDTTQDCVPWAHRFQLLQGKCGTYRQALEATERSVSSGTG
ncbi:hypothetical protein CRM22_006644 [Opisthorchis felineus]|uniref:Uncharacterized protein n=1 Tax=Opisthorchis felineus TaxID=147828 RepID=A0A4S2LJT9_OPIFE|nr:hypothetical protein CRM22_006644 [Opisthorchis felineus]